MISITRIDSLRRKIARQLLKKTIKPSPLFLFRCSFLHVPMITARHISNDRVFFIVRMKPYVAGERSSKPDHHHQVVHLLGGFIFVPRGQRNASANAWEFIIIPLTLVFRKEGKKITRALISSSVSFDREWNVSRIVSKLQSIPFGLRCVVIELNGKNVGLGSHVGTVGLERKK